jgi:hypothetical protein
MRSLLLIACIVGITTTSSALAVTKEQIKACYPDAIRLCRAPPDGHMSEWQKVRVIACLLRHVPEISAECKAAF